MGPPGGGEEDPIKSIYNIIIQSTTTHIFSSPRLTHSRLSTFIHHITSSLRLEDTIQHTTSLQANQNGHTIGGGFAKYGLVHNLVDVLMACVSGINGWFSEIINGNIIGGMVVGFN